MLMVQMLIDDDGAAPAMPGEPVIWRLGPDGGCVLKCEPTLVMIAS